MTARRITLRVDRITVAGAGPSRAALAKAIERELATLLTAPGTVDTLRSAGAVARLNGGRIAPKGPGEVALGRAIAQATMGALRR